MVAYFWASYLTMELVWGWMGKKKYWQPLKEGAQQQRILEGAWNGKGETAGEKIFKNGSGKAMC